MGFLMYGLGYSVQLVRRDLHISRALASVHQLVFAVLLIISSLFLTRIISRYNPTAVMKSGWVVVIVGMSFYVWGLNIWVSVFGYSLCAIGATLFNNTNAATLGQVKGSSLPLMLRTTGIATATGAFAPTILGALVARGFSWRLTLLIFALVVGFISMRAVPNVPDRFPTADNGSRLVDREYSLMLAFGLAANFLEIGAGSWALDLLISRHLGNSAALVLASLFSFGIASGRLASSSRAHFGATKIWLASTTLSAIGLGVVISTSNSALTVWGLVIASIGIGPLGGIALAFASDSPKGADTGISANVIGAALAIGLGPMVVGIVSDGFGFSLAYSISALMLVVATTLFFIVRSDRAS